MHDDWAEIIASAEGELKRAVWLVLKAVAFGAVIALLVLATMSAARAQAPLSRLLDANGYLDARCASAPRAQPLPVPEAASAPTAAMTLPRELGGPCGAAIVEANAKGAAVAWWCPQPNGGPAIALYAVTWAWLAGNPGAALDYAALAAPGASAPERRIDAMRTRSTLDVRDMCDVWGPMVARVNAARPAPMAAPTYRVKANAAAGDGSRPVYDLKADGTLGSKELGRAQKYTPCDATLPTRASVGTDLYATPSGWAARQVALCQRVAP